MKQLQILRRWRVHRALRLIEREMFTREVEGSVPGLNHGEQWVRFYCTWRRFKRDLWVH